MPRRTAGSRNSLQRKAARSTRTAKPSATSKGSRRRNEVRLTGGRVPAKCSGHTCVEREYGYQITKVGDPVLKSCTPASYENTCKAKASTDEAKRLAKEAATDWLDAKVKKANDADKDDCPDGCLCDKPKNFGPAVTVAPGRTHTFQPTVIDQNDSNKTCTYDVIVTYDWTCREKLGKCYIDPDAV